MTPQEVRKAWIEALRSGKYAQGIRSLNCGDNFCCLGVLCDLYVKEHPETPTGSLINSNRMWYVKKDYVAFLPPEIQDWAGLHARQGSHAGGHLPLHMLNDQEHFSFSKIADILEKEDGYFKCT